MRSIGKAVRSSATALSIVHVAALARATVLDLDHAVDQTSADDDDRRHADQFCVVELDARRYSDAIVEQHAQAGGLAVDRQAFGRGNCGSPALPVATM